MTQFPSLYRGPEPGHLPALSRLPLPLFVLQPILARIVRKVAADEPSVFNRLGPHKHTRYIIDPANMPFVLQLHPDPDGMELKTLDGKPFLAVNGIQTLSQSYLNYLTDLPDLVSAGITHFRLSPHTQDMVAIAGLFRAVLDGELGADEAEARLRLITGAIPFANGFWHGKPGHLRV